MANRVWLSVVVPLAIGLVQGTPAQAHSHQDVDRLSAVSATPKGRPFPGIRYYYVPSQKRYRAVKFSPRSPSYPPGHSAGAFSQGPGGASCFNGTKRSSTYVGTLYSIPSGPTYTKSYTLNDLFFGQVTYTAPGWFKRKARTYLNGNGVCAVW